MGIDLGKIMVTPRGDYQADVEYERNDLVAYLGSSYIALKTVEGITPSHDGVNWQLHGSGAYQCAKEAGYEGTEEEFRAAQAGMAGHMKEKNPHGMTASDVGTIPIYTSLAQLGMTAGSETAKSIYESMPDGSMLIYYINIDNSDNSLYSGLKTLFGNNINGTIVVYKLLSGRFWFEYVSSCEAKTATAIYMNQNDRFIDWFSHLPLTGGTLSGQLLFKSGEAVYQIVPQSDGNFIIRSTSMGLCMNHANNLNNFLYLTDFNTGVGYKLFGEHNKPSGSYTGNGSVTERKIATGGSGNCAVITSDEGTAIITRRGVFVGDISTHSYIKNDNVISDGTMWLKTTHNTLNKSGVVYTYQVL